MGVVEGSRNRNLIPHIIDFKMLDEINVENPSDLSHENLCVIQETSSKLSARNQKRKSNDAQWKIIRVYYDHGKKFSEVINSFNAAIPGNIIEDAVSLSWVNAGLKKCPRFYVVYYVPELQNSDAYFIAEICKLSKDRLTLPAKEAKQTEKQDYQKDDRDLEQLMAEIEETTGSNHTKNSKKKGKEKSTGAASSGSIEAAEVTTAENMKEEEAEKAKTAKADLSATAAGSVKVQAQKPRKRQGNK